jgi:hypothetical protein
MKGNEMLHTPIFVNDTKAQIVRFNLERQGNLISGGLEMLITLSGQKVYFCVTVQTTPDDYCFVPNVFCGCPFAPLQALDAEIWNWVRQNADHLARTIRQIAPDSVA